MIIHPTKKIHIMMILIYFIDSGMQNINKKDKEEKE